MPVHLVTWNLNKERAGYDAARAAFLNQLDTIDNIKAPGLDSVRFVPTSSTAKEVSDYLVLKMDGNDRLVVSKFNMGEYWGVLAKDVWDWIAARQ